MFFDAPESDRLRAKTPHELMMFNLFAFHLLATPAILFSGIGEIGVLLPPLLSGAVILYVWWRTARPESWFVRAHWRLALARCRLLLIAYGISAGLLALAWLLSQGAGRTQEIMFTVLTRVAVMPTVVMVFVVAVLESSGLYQAAKGEVPDRIAEQLGTPDGGNS